VLSVIRWQLVVDFLVLTVAFYGLLRWASSARALRVALAVVGLHALALLAQRLDLVVTSWVLDGSALLAIILLLVIFQPELRRAFMRLDSVIRHWPRPPEAVSQQNQVIARAAFDLASDRIGALIVIVRRDSIAELTEGGVLLGAAVSPELLLAVFQKVSPLHDGAVVVEGGHLVKAGVVLPLTQRQDVPGFYGTRHRAGMGLAERCDALVTVVSEERGEVTLMYGSKLVLTGTPEKLAGALEELQGGERKSTRVHLRRFFLTGLRLKLAALGLAGLIWSMSFLASGATIRTVTVPIEFSNVPGGMEIGDQSADSVELQVRGSPWIMDSISMNKLIARFDLRSLGAGSHSLALVPRTLALPPGLVVDKVTPAKIRVTLTSSRTGTPPARVVRQR
jgi:diadenylate cyclase